MYISIDGDVPSKRAHSFQVLKMAQGFKNIGEDVTLITGLNWTVLKNRLKVRDLFGYYGVKPLKIKRVWVYNADFFRRSVGGVGYNQKVADVAKASRVNYIYARGYLTPYFCALNKIPVIAEIHSVNFTHPDLARLFTLKDNPYFLGVVTIHESIKNQYIKMGISQEKILVQEDGVDLERFNISDDREYWIRKLGLDPQKKYVVYAGGLYAEKGIEDILNVAKYLENDHSIRFLFAGGRENEIREWQAYCSTHHIRNAIWKGFVPNIDIPCYLKAASCLIMPYSLKRKYKVMDINTTSPLKLFEYMASNRPIVSTCIPVIQKIVTHLESAFLAEPDNHHQLAEYVKKCVEHDSESRAIAAKALMDVKKFSWETRCRNILTHFGVNTL